MAPDQTTAPTPVHGGEVMAAIDDAGPTERLVLADVSRDDAWLSVGLEDAAALDDRQ